jgi:D-glycerate 3-kinase
MRIFQYYLPVFFWCWGQVKDHQAGGQQAPLVIGIQAVQGCGKTTLVAELQSLFAHVGLKAASVSVDDFYLPFRQQQELIQVSSFCYLMI